MYATDFAQVGNNIQRIMKENNITKSEFADILGISEQAMNGIIKGYKAINLNEISKIADGLQTTTDDLLTVTNESLKVYDIDLIDGIQDPETKGRIELIRNAIDEILLLEELLGEE